MRLLLDESLSARIASLLPQASHDVVRAADVDLLGGYSRVAAWGRDLVKLLPVLWSANKHRAG